MPGRSTGVPTIHIRQWKHNRAFLATVEPRFPDWAVTAAFYTALHAVDTLLNHDNVGRITSHAARNDMLMRTNRYSKIWSLYQPLYDLSRTVRYMANPSGWVPWEQVETQVLGRHLYPLERSVEKLAGLDLGLGPVRMKSAP